jgi:hypothetical protein
MTTALFAFLLLAHWESPTAGAVAPPCVEKVTDDATLDQALGGLTIQVGGQGRPISDVRLLGLTTLPEASVWRAVGGGWEVSGSPIDARRVVGLVRRLHALGAFSRVSPAVRVKDDKVTVDVTVVEHPTLRKVVFEGLTEVKPRRLLEAVVEGHEHGDEKESTQACRDAVAPRAWFASRDGDVVKAGILQGGAQAAVDRVVHALFGLGYQLGALQGELGPDGVLTVRVDEGRLEAVELRGVAPAIEGRVRERLALHVGKPFQAGELDEALGRVKGFYPFLSAGHAAGPAPAPPKLEMSSDQGVLRFQTVPSAPAVAAPAPKSDDDDDDDDEGDDEDDEDHHHGHEHGRHRPWYELRGHTLVLTFSANRTNVDFDVAELLRHTPVTGFAPGLILTTRLADPADRIHATFELGGNVNTHRATSPDDSRHWRFDWLAAGKIQVPRLRLAELGIQGYAKVDTADRWRIDRVDSYLYSMLFDRAYSDYFRREGFTALLTFHLFDHLTAGVEYRQDRYQSLATADKAYSLFNRGQPRRPTAPVTEGAMHSLLFRLEYTTGWASLRDVGGPFRDPERTQVFAPSRRKAELRTSNTLEVADPALGGDATFHFVKLVSDTTVEELVGAKHRLKLRFRAAGRLGDGTLPLQKEEALGGWTALRGYDFKELAGGNFSLLGTLEYRYQAFSAFFDLGSLRTGESFGAARAAAGVALNLGESAHLDFAWRLDDRARALPVVRFFFQRTF